MEKLNFMNSKNTLNRSEMKNIMAGSSGSGSCNPPCSSTAIACCCGGGKVTCVQTIQACLSFCGL
jgi:hypothetical protein